MAKSKIVENLESQQDSDVLEGQEALPDTGVRPEDLSAVVPFRGLAESQTRRRLHESEILPYVKGLVAGSLADDDPAAIMEILGQIARASTFEEALGGNETVKGREILDTTLEVWGYKFVMSDKEKGCPYFVLLDAKDTRTGKVEMVSVGGWKVIGACAWAHYAARDLPEGSEYLVAPGSPGAIAHMPYPHYFKIHKEETSKGNTVNLLRLPHQ